MKLNTEDLKKYAGGQLEIQNPNTGERFCGEIGRAWVKCGMMRVHFVWFAKLGEDGRWHNEENLEYVVNLKILVVTDTNDSLTHYKVDLAGGETGTFFPPWGSKLDSRRIVGLQATT